MEAFVYCWTDHKTHKLYVGSHKGNTTDGYVCSSKPMMEEYHQRPQDFSRQIIATGSHGIFESIVECSQALNMNYDNVWYKLKTNQKGWEYLP